MTKIFDAHCDTLQKICEQRKETHLKLSEIKDGYIQVFAAFCSEEKSAWQYVNRLIDAYDSLETEKIMGFKDVSLEGKEVKAILSVEGGECIGDDLSRLDILWSRGVRMMTLTWNFDNKIASGALSEKDNGLSDFGKKVIRRMERLKIAVDVSHLGEKSFYDCMEFVKRPVAASHSNSRAVCDNKRNLTDRQFEEIVKNKGIVGVNFYPPFLNKDAAAGIEDIIRHIDHFLMLGGEDCIGIGSDFDGVSHLPSGLESTEGLYTLAERLYTNYGMKISDKILYGNFLQFFKRNFS